MNEAEKVPLSAPGEKKNRYAWVIFAVCFMMVFTALGFASSTKTTFQAAITGSLGLKRGLYSLLETVRFLTTAAISFFMGRIVKKLSLRRIAGCGFLVLTAAMLADSFGQTYWHFYIGGALVGFGLAWTTTSFVGYIVERWFTTGKGSIMGIIMAANGLGGMTSEQTITRIIYGADGALTDAQSRWRLAYRVIALLFLLMALLCFLLIRDDPSDMGLKPLGEGMKQKKRRGASWEGLPFSELKHRSFFRMGAVSVFLTGMALQSMYCMSKPYMYDLGLDKNYVLTVFSVYSLLLCAAKILAGMGYDLIGIRRVFLCCCFFALAALTGLFLVSEAQPGLAWVYGCCAAFGFPLETVMLPLIVSEVCGMKDYVRILGYTTAVNTLGYALGGFLINQAYDILGSYRDMIPAVMVIMCISALLAQLAFSGAEKERKKQMQRGKMEQ